MISTVLNVVPHGVVQSGSATINIDEFTGVIDLSESIVVGWLFFTQTIANNRELKIDPDALLSSSIKVGLKLVIGQLTLTVESVLGTVANVSLVAQDSDKWSGVSGSAALDLSQKYFELTHLQATGVVEGSNIELELVKQ